MYSLVIVVLIVVTTYPVMKSSIMGLLASGVNTKLVKIERKLESVYYQTKLIFRLQVFQTFLLPVKRYSLR